MLKIRNQFFIFSLSGESQSGRLEFPVGIDGAPRKEPGCDGRRQISAQRRNSAAA